MEINLFQILILLFIFYPLIRRVLDGLRPKEEEAEEAEAGQEPAAEDPWSDRAEHGRRPASSERAQHTATQRGEAHGEQSWEDFFDGLEKVLTGDESSRQQQQTQQNTPKRDAAHVSRTQGTQAAASATQSGRGSRPEPSRSHASHGPIHSSGTESYDPYTYEQKSDTEIGAQAEKISRELIEGDNPIYTELDDTQETAVTETRGRKYVKRMLMNPEKLRDGILLKEILDPPKS
ncbi:MAG: hypothetical protein ACQETM_04355, partial [Bacteroidota bacterium]